MNRYFWVLWTYVTRPMVWLLTIATVMIVSMLLWIGTSADLYVSTLSRVSSLSLDLSRLRNPQQSESFDLGQLRNLKQLESLDFGQISKVKSMDVIKNLPRLTSISFGSPRLITKDNMQLISEVSSLRDVYLPDIADESDALEAIELLNQSRSLKTVHVAIPLAESDKFTLVRDRIANIRVQTSQYRPILGFFIFVFFLLPILFCQITLHVTGQFAMPHAVLSPNYKAVHRRVWWCLVLIILIGLFLAASIVEIDPIALGLIGSSLFFLYASWYIVELLGQTQATIKWNRFIVVTVAFLTLGIFYFLHSHPIMIEQWAASLSSWRIAIGFVVTLLLAIRFDAMLRSICRSRYEVGRKIALSFFDFQATWREQAYHGRDDDSDPEMRSIRNIGRFGVVALVLAVLLQLNGHLFDAFPFLQIVVVPASITILSGLAIWIGGVYWRRMPFVSTMIHRPPTRTAQVNEIMSGVGKDMCRLIPLALASVVLTFDAQPFSYSPILRVLLFISFQCAAAAVIYVLIIWGLMIRTVSGLIPYFIAAYVASIVLIGGVSILQERASSPLLVIAVTSALIIASIFVSRLARRRLMSFEWGKIR